MKRLFFHKHLNNLPGKGNANSGTSAIPSTLAEIQFMKLICIVTAYLLFLNLCGYTQNKFELRSCKIRYVFSTGIQKGTKDIVFNDSGRVIKETAVMYLDTTGLKELFKSSINFRPVSHSLTITTSDSITSIDLDSLVGKTIRRLSPIVDWPMFQKQNFKRVG